MEINVISKDVLELLAKTLSDNPKTQVVCVLTSLDGRRTVAGNSHSHPAHKQISRTEAPVKHQWLMHAEAKAIAMAARSGISTQGAVLQVNWFPCAPCAHSIIAAGISLVICDRAKYEERKDDPAYSFEVSWAALLEAGVRVEFI